VLLSFLSKNFVSTKWRIYKGILASPRLQRQGISRGCRECELVFIQQSLQKQLYQDLKWKTNFLKEKKLTNGLFTKSNSSEQNIYRNRRLKISFQCCCASQNKTQKIKTKQTQ
jgi:hypothetical protein